MKVKLLISRAGVDFSQNVDDIVDVGDEEGRRLIEQNKAVPHVETKRETATRKPPEKRKK